MKISIVIPTYKPGDYLDECLRSVGAQSLNHNNFEVVIVLNGCNEPWATSVKALCDKHLSDIATNIIQTDTPGVSNARNVGIESAKGDYITFIDDDDYISPSYLERLAEKATPGTVVFTNCISFYDEDRSVDENYTYRRAYYNLRNCNSKSTFKNRRLLNSPWMKLFARNCIGKYRFNTHFKLGEDSLLMFALSCNIKDMAFTSDDAVYYRRFRKNSASMVPQKTASRIKNSLALMWDFSKSYFSCPFKYNLLFYISRIVAVSKNMILG